MIKKIAIVAGGYSGEYEISMKSAAQVKKNLDETHYEAYIVEITKKEWIAHLDDGKKIPVDKGDFSFHNGKQKISFDCIFNSIHGTPGEDGKLQSYFEFLNIPITSCNAATSMLTFNKFATKAFLEKFGIVTANAALILHKDEFDPQAIIKDLGLPCFVKPNNNGSSVGISKVSQTTELKPAIQKAMEDDSEVIIESFIEGREFTCGLFKTHDRAYIFPVTEVISGNEFFDYEAKYTPGKSNEITPADIPGTLMKECQDISSKIYDLLNCKGFVRIDYIYSNGVFYFLEINTVPGMSESSIIPQQIRAAGYTIKEMYGNLIEEALQK
jgi:D-alanine-D-alanine ligase